MLSKKMAFSLMSLITIFALAFVAPSAMAAEFDVALDVRGDISSADDLQLEHPGTSLVVRVLFDQAVLFDAATAFITTYDEDDNFVSLPVAKGAPAKTVASKEITLTIPVTAAVVRVNLKIAKDIESADPINTDKSAALDVNIFLVGADSAAGPAVYSIRRTDNFLLPVTADTVPVIVTLSEMPKEFKKGNLSISGNATISKEPEALDPVPERALDTENIASALREAGAIDSRAPTLRSVYDSATGEADGIHASFIATAPAALTAAYVTYTALTAGTPRTATAIADYPTDAAAALGYSIPLFRPVTTFTLAITATTTTAADLVVPDFTEVEVVDAVMVETIIAGIEAGVGLQDRTTDPGDPPDPFDYAEQGPEAYLYADRLYKVRKAEYDKYQAENALYTAYTTAVEAEQDIDQAIIDEYYRISFGADVVQRSTGRDAMLYPYVVTITPKYLNKDNIVLKVGAWEDTNVPIPNRYTPPRREANYREGVDKLTIKVGKDGAPAGTAGHEVFLKKRVIPAGGYLIVTANSAESGINIPADGQKDNHTPVNTARSPAEMKYNLVQVALPNLEVFLTNSGTIDLVSPSAGLFISEIMWGSDASLTTNSNSQWIEIYNTTAANIALGDNENTKLVFYGPNETVPAKTAAVAATATTAPKPVALPAGVVDRVGTIDDTGAGWSLTGIGQSGRTGFGEAASDLIAIIPTLPLYSMYRGMVPTTVAGIMIPEDGNTAAAWIQSTPPALNFDPAGGGNRIASPGDDDFETPAEATERLANEKLAADRLATAADTSVSMPKVGQIYISEIMFAGGGRLPQWIEISNGSRSEQVDLSDWTITVDNAAADADVSVGATATFTIPKGTKIDPSGQYDTPSTILVVTEKGRNDLVGADAADQVLNLEEDNEVDLILAGVTTGKYTLLSDMAFMITLAPLVPKAATPPTSETVTARAQRQADEKVAAKDRADATDMVGNLGADGAAAWVLPMSEEGGRSSIIRRHIQIARGPAAPEDGTMMESWALASDTSFAQITHIRASSYYGAANDVGTPGFRAGGALPVELSQFRPARNKETGAVMITWSTQSELNNAGFFIKRSQQPNGEFQIINATMIPGAGTSSEKQSYTYEDTTAQPNVVYYYQIEDVSLDGNRQTLTRGIRLKGHVSVAGKATLTWGELKTSQ